MNWNPTELIFVSELFRGYMHQVVYTQEIVEDIEIIVDQLQDAHEFLNYILNDIAEQFDGSKTKVPESKRKSTNKDLSESDKERERQQVEDKNTKGTCKC